MSDEKTEKNPSPKFRLRSGLRATNVEVYEVDGSRHTERLEPGKVYEGEKYVRWCPSVLMALPETLKAGLPAAPETPVRRGRRRLRPGIGVSEGMRSGAVATPTTTLTKKDPTEAMEKSKVDEEAERGKPPVEPEGKTPEQEEAEKVHEEPLSEPQKEEETTPEEPDEWADYEEPEITSKTDLRRMKKDELLTLALYHEYDVSDEEYNKDDLLDVLYEHYGLD